MTRLASELLAPDAVPSQVVLGFSQARKVVIAEKQIQTAIALKSIIFQMLHLDIFDWQISLTKIFS